MIRYILPSAILMVLLSWQAEAQSLTDSNLPIIIINTDGEASILNNPRVLATLKVIYRGKGLRNYVTDQDSSSYLNYNGRIDIEIRGSSSQVTEKKQYAFTTRKADGITNNNVSLLGMPSENDWILNGMTFDPAMIRDYLCYNLSRQIGEYASRTAYCEVIINNIYKGLYLLQEKIKADDNRVNIIKIGTNDIYFPEVTGGYITKADKTTGGDPVAWTMYSWTGAIVNYIHDLPKPETVTPEQNSYIYSQFDNLATAAVYHNISLTDGIPHVIDVPSFIDYMIISELSSNADAYQFSTFFHKDRNGKLRAGPIWDNDLTYGNDLFFWGFDRSKTNIWQLSNGDNDGSRFWRDLFNTSLYKCYLAKRWNELILPGQPLNQDSIDNFIDETIAITGEAILRDNNLWGTVGDLSLEINSIKTFLNSRIPWITENLGSFSLCNNVSIPPLVITKINYHPKASTDFPDGDKLEFIEITNTGNTTINLTGIYFSGTGLVYQFPVNSTIFPESSIFLAGNSTSFKAKYGFTPFGQYTRYLSNKSRNIVLADGFGNVIDNVFYSDSLPWPDADGNGYYLMLTDPALDNNVGSNWTAVNDPDIRTDYYTGNEYFRIYPNPVDEILNISSNNTINQVMVYDVQGRLLVSEKISNETWELNVSHFPVGAYIIKVITSSKVYTRGIIKR